MTRKELNIANSEIETNEAEPFYLMTGDIQKLQSLYIAEMATVKDNSSEVGKAWTVVKEPGVRIVRNPFGGKTLFFFCGEMYT